MKDKNYKTALPTEYTDKLFESWQNIIDRDEICSIVTPPVFAYEYRIANFIDWQKKNGYVQAKHFHIYVDLLFDPEDIKQLFLNEDRPLIISPGSFLLSKDLFSVISAITYYSVKYKKPVLIFFESTVTEIKKLPGNVSHQLLQNISYIPLFSLKNTQHFCMHIAERWNFKLNSRQINEIHEYTGGHVWLVKEVLRQMSKNDLLLNKIFGSKEIQYKKEKIWSQLNKEHKELIISFAQNNFKSSSNNLVRDDLENLGFIKNGFCKLPTFIRDLSLQVQHDIQIVDSEILFNNVNVTSFFSKKEQKIFLAFSNSLDNKVSRDKVAFSIWGDENNYSEWALDKSMSRFRTKLKKLGISGKSLVTLREHGYQLLLK